MVAVGIDLGTTFSAVAAVDLAGRPRVLPGRDGAATMPSVVSFEGETPLVGRAAKLAASTAPGDCVELVKRHMGEPSWRYETAAGTPYTAEQISALILTALAQDAGAALGRPVHEAVITVPAYFDDVRRRATVDAGRIAGLTVLGVLNEPTAAALAFGYGARGADATLLVYDLGGGTLDTTVVRVGPGGCEVLATDGDRNLGGFDFDNALMRHVNESVQAAGGPDLFTDDLLDAALRDACEQAKRELSTLPDTAIRVAARGHQYAVPVTRATFESLTAGLLRRTEEIVMDVLDAAGAAVSGVLLVGGSTRMPMVAAMVERVTGARADRSVHPDEAVALGAAVRAAELTRPTPSARAAVRDVTAHGLGLLARSTETGGQTNSVVIPRNTAVPCEGRRRYRTLAENQQEILLEVTEGEDTDPAYVTIVGSGWVSIPPRAEPTVLDIVMSYDEDGMIEVDVLDAESGLPLGDFALDRQSNLDAQEVERMRAALHAVAERRQ